MQETPKNNGFLKKAIICAVSLLLVGALVAGIIIVSNMGKNSKYDPQNYNSTIHTVSGGKKQKDANINEITVKNENDAVNITIKFISGSVVEENVEKCGIPEYSLQFLESPLRLKISFKEIAYWDYMVMGTPTDSTGLINGVFQKSPYKQGDDVELYFSLTKAVEFKIIENDDALTVSLVAKEQDTSEKWYLVSDLYYEYQAGEMPECGFTPMLCNDNISVIMISNAYSSFDEANKAMEELLKTTLKDKKIRIISLKQGQLPAYTDSADAQALLSESVLSVNGAKTTLPLFYADARFLCWIPDGSGAVFAKAEDGVEKLYTADKNGTKHILVDQGFTTVIKAVYSQDGSRLAFVEQAEDTSLVTVVDVKSGKINVIGQDSWGDIIMGIQLNENGTKLYCLSGNTTYSIKCYDFATGAITTIVENILLESDLVYKSGYLYYCDIINEYEAIVRKSISGGDVELIHKGSQFTMSSDGKKIAVISEEYETAVCDLIIVDIENKTTETVLGDIVTSEFFFTSSGESMFYILETGDPEYYYQLMRYDILTKETTTVAQCINSVFYPSDKDNEIIISVIYSSETGEHPVTYIADFDKMVVGESNEPQQG